jgi:hypothetical protein
MLKTFTFVKMQPGYNRDAFFERWCQHTRDFDLRNHPEIRENRLMLIEGDGPYVGIAETHWEDAEALDRGVRWYETPTGQVQWKDLQTFMDADNSPTFVVTHEANVSIESGIEILTLGAQQSTQ